MIEHLFDLIDVIARPHVEDLGDQVLKQMSHLLLYPVVLGILVGYDLEFIVIEVPRCSEWRYTENRCGITATDSSSSVFQPIALRQVLCVYKHVRLIALCCSVGHLMHLAFCIASRTPPDGIPFARDTSFLSSAPFSEFAA